MYLYILGRGHSGSTILDILLGNSAQIESVGELIAGLSRADREPCSCGASMPECPFWRHVRSRLEDAGVSWDEARSIGTEKGIAGMWRVLRGGQKMERRAVIVRALAKAITATAGKPHLLDSSKTPAHGLFLLRHIPEARLIHLVRDPRDVLRSGLKRGQGPLALLRTVVGWAIINPMCDLMARAYPRRVIRVRYEDLCASPACVLDKIGGVLWVSLSDALARIEHLEVGHNVGGNRIRHAGVLRFDADVGQTKHPMPRWLEVVTLLLCEPVMWRYGYLRDNKDLAPQVRRRTA